jgi:hypothetical protein
VSYQAGKSLKYYVNQAGGYGDRAKKRRAYVIYMNGQVKRLKSKHAKGIMPGSEIVIPVKEKHNWQLQNTLAIATTSASLATMLATISNLLK